MKQWIIEGTLAAINGNQTDGKLKIFTIKPMVSSQTYEHTHPNCL